MKQVLCMFLIVTLLQGCSSRNKSAEESPVVFCAASLTDVMSEIIKEFENKNHIHVKLNLASSGTLARQIEHGANPAIYISANKKWISYLNKLNLIIPETEKEIAGNTMVFVVPLKSKLKPIPFSDRMNLPQLFDGRLVIGDPQHVPAGMYAMQILENLGWEQDLKSRILPAKDVRSALMWIELGEVDGGIVYKTDALKSEKVRIITEFPDSVHNKVGYYMALIHKNQISVKLYNYISSEQSKLIWEKYGFLKK